MLVPSFPATLPPPSPSVLTDLRAYSPMITRDRSLTLCDGRVQLYFGVIDLVSGIQHGNVFAIRDFCDDRDT